MGSYRYQVRASDGSVKAGTLTADNAASAAAILKNQGAHVVSIDSIQASAAANGLLAKLKELNAGKPSTKHVLDFTTQLAVMIRAGINLRAALEGIAEQTTHLGFRRVVQQLKQDVESGKQFSEALARHPKLFSSLYVNMVRASEMTGQFSEMLDRIAGYITQEIETRKMVIGASIYPGVIGTLAVGVTIFLLTFVLPKFAGVFKGKEEVLPWATKFLMGLSDFMVHHWPVVLGAAAAIIGGIWGFLRTEVGAFAFDRFKLACPIIRGMFRALYISRSLHTMGQLINAGVGLLESLAITGDIAGNRLYQNLWTVVAANVKTGKKIAAPLQKTTLLPRSVVQMISAGEESGKIGEVLDEISTYYSKQLKDKIKAVTSMIEPIMIIVMGSVVGFIAMAIILPIFKMSAVVR